MNKTFFIKRITPIILGMLIGYLYYYFIGCNNGQCLIQSNPYFSTLYGGLIGLLFAIPTKRKNKKEE